MPVIAQLFSSWYLSFNLYQLQGNLFRMAEDGNLARYEKKKLLGKGTFGEAWLVVSTASGRLGDLVIANSATRFSEDS